MQSSLCTGTVYSTLPQSNTKIKIIQTYKDFLRLACEQWCLSRLNRNHWGIIQHYLEGNPIVCLHVHKRSLNKHTYLKNRDTEQMTDVLENLKQQALKQNKHALNLLKSLNKGHKILWLTLLMLKNQVANPRNFPLNSERFCTHFQSTFCYGSTHPFTQCGGSFFTAQWELFGSVMRAVWQHDKSCLK